MKLLDQSRIDTKTGHYYRRPGVQLEQLPPPPGECATPEEWREYHQALYEAGLLDPSQEGGDGPSAAERIFGEKYRLP